ncbi:hypothetical protein [Brachybacterium huguangmaarense]
MSGRNESFGSGGAPLFAETLRQAMADGGWTAGGLASAARKAGSPVSAPTLRTWRSGESGPARRASMRSLAVLDSLLGLEDGVLETAIRRDREHAEVSESDPELAEQLAAIDAARSAWDLPAVDEIEQSTVIARLDLGDPDAPRILHRVQVTALRDGASRMVCALDDRWAPALERATPDAVHIGRSTRAAGALLVELELDPPLLSRECVLIELDVPLDVAEPPRVFRAVTSAPAIALVTQLVLPPDSSARGITAWSAPLGSSRRQHDDGARARRRPPLHQIVIAETPAVLVEIGWSEDLDEV